MWGDIFFVLSSIMFLLQPIFLVYADPNFYTYERDADYYFATNVFMLIDASCYSVGYHMYMTKLRSSLINGIVDIKRGRTDGFDGHRKQELGGGDQSDFESKVNMDFCHHPSDLKLRDDVTTSNPLLNDSGIVQQFLGTRSCTPDRISTVPGKSTSGGGEATSNEQMSTNNVAWSDEL
jgi:hypothetical protein